MSPAGAIDAVAGFVAAACGVASLWRGAGRQGGPVRRAYRWFALAAVLAFANLLILQAASLPSTGATMLSFADLPALLLPLVMAAGLARLASARQPVAPEPPRPRQGPATGLAQLADGYVLASAVFLICWAALFGQVFTGSGESPGTFAAELVHPLADLVVLAATLGVATAAGGRGVPPYLALACFTVSDSLAVGARVSGDHPGAGAVAAGLAGLALLALTPVSWRLESPGARWVGGQRGVSTAVAAAVAVAAALLVTVQALAGAHLSEPVVFAVLGSTVVALAVRVVGLVRRVNSWARAWRETGTRFRQLAERTSDVVLLCDLAGVIRYASRAVADYGYSPGGLPGTPLAGLLHPEDRSGGMRAVRRAVAGTADRVSRYPCRVRAADGSWRHVESTISRYLDPGGQDQLLVTARDVTSQVELRRQVAHLAAHDGLTGLPNRAFVEQRSGEILGRAGASGVILLDVDGFTAVNESAGLGAGDLLLAQIARRLRLAVSPQDTVARWGGDEFAVLVEEPGSASEIVEIAERLARGVALQPYRAGEADLTLTTSVGVAFADGSPAREVWRNAEVAMSQAKESGGGRVEIFGGRPERLTPPAAETPPQPATQPEPVGAPDPSGESVGDPC